MNSNQDLGRRGENAAARYVAQLGWKILDRNWRCREGELDIIAYDGHQHIICEVKTRRSITYGAPAEALTLDKASRLRRLAHLWADQHGVSTKSLRIDLIGLTGGGPSGFTVDHMREVA